MSSQAGASNSLGVGIVQPLLRGAGPLVAHEGLRQSERNMLYSVQDFRRFQQAFIIEAAARYYALLSSQDQLRNARRNHQSAVADSEKIIRLASGGRRSNLEADQARQRKLEAEIGWANAQTNYLNRLDDYKRFLGLPIDLDLGPDPAELDSIARRGLLRPQMALDEAVRIALEDRLDFQTANDGVADSRRRKEIALKRSNISLEQEKTN